MNLATQAEDTDITFNELPNVATLQFPTQIHVSQQKAGLSTTATTLYRHIAVSNRINKEDPHHNFFNYLTKVIDLTIGTFYRQTRGRYWRSQKLQEMIDEPLVYVYYSTNKEEIAYNSSSKIKAKTQSRKKRRVGKIFKLESKKIANYAEDEEKYDDDDDDDDESSSQHNAGFSSIKAFLSFMYTEENSKKILYLYEIHVVPELQGFKVGNELMKGFLGSVKQMAQKTRFECRGSLLTVFSENEKAYRWYLRHGFVLADDSPFDEEIRPGIVEKPECYILYRPVNLIDTNLL